MLLGIYNFSNSATQRRRPNDINLSDLNSNQAPLPRNQNQAPFPGDQIPLAGNQSTSQNSTPRAVNTPSEHF